MKPILNCLEFDENPTDPFSTAYFLTSLSGGLVRLDNSTDDDFIELPVTVLKEMALYLNQLDTEVLPLAEEAPTPSILKDIQYGWSVTHTP